MVQKKIVIDVEYDHHRDSFQGVSELVDVAEGANLLYDGRNRIVRSSLPDGSVVAIKRYKKFNVFKSIVYTLFTANKAKAAFNNAIELRKRGFSTPREIAYIEENKLGFITRVYYICRYSDKRTVPQQLLSVRPFDKEFAAEYAAYVAELHKKGVLHLDFNSGNVLCDKSSGGYKFELIDINRMRFYSKEVPKTLCMKNLALFWHNDDVYRYVLDIYADAKGWSQDDLKEAFGVKLHHDKAWIRKKKFSSFFKKYILRRR